MSDRIDLGAKPWKAIPREVLRDQRLSPRALGGLVTLLSHDDGWVRSAIGILMREKHCGRAQAQAIMRELRDAGYAELVTERDLEGHISSHYIVRAESVGSGPQTSESPVAGEPARRETVRREPGLEKLEPQTLEPLDVEPTASYLAPATPARRADPVFEAIAEACSIDWHALTKSARGTLNAATGEIRKATPEADRAEVLRRAGNWPFDVELTPMGLAKHWPRLNGAPRPKRSGNWLDRLYREAHDAAG